jgi:hypothetical protein
MNRRRFALLLALVIVSGLAFNSAVIAHRTVVSPYTFHRDVVPILEARCGRCHEDGSASGLPLFRYERARAEIWPIQLRLIRGHMPPWFAEGAFKSPAPVTARELNILMTWASGGGPEGLPVPRNPRPSPAWPMGPPDVIVPMPAAFTFTGEQPEQIHEVALQPRQIAGRMIRAVDLSPGTPAIVRSAEIIARSGAREQVLGLWQPGDLPTPFAVPAGFRMPRNASLVLRVRYQRHYGDPASDRSEVGVYFAESRAADIQTLTFSAEPSRPETHTLRGRARAVAIRPIGGPSGSWVRFTAIGADGARTELARLQIQRAWTRRYVFDTPVTIPAGNKIEVSVIPSESQQWTVLTGEPSEPDSAVRVALEFVD